MRPATHWRAAQGEPTVTALLRHGQTPMSVQKRYAGRTDAPLTEVGVQQAAAAAKRLASAGLGVIVTSPLLRTVQTAQVVAAVTGAAVVTDDGFRETDFGAWEGLTFAEVRERWPAEISAWMADPEVAPPGGESFTDVSARVTEALDRVLAARAGQTVLIVSHVTPIKMLVAAALLAPPAALYRMHLDVAALSEIDWYADGPAVLRGLPADLVARFEQQGWVLTRNYNEDIGASVEQAFGTGDRHAVESYCRANAIEFDWQPDGGLRTRQRRSAVVAHPVTGQRCWFNQIAFLNERTIDPEVREYLVEVYGQDGLPFTTFFGNGDPVGAAVVDLLNQTYEAHTAREPWQAGDLLLVDNIRTAHSREPYDGPREVLAALADPVHLADCSPATEGTPR